MRTRASKPLWMSIVAAIGWLATQLATGAATDPERIFLEGIPGQVPACATCHGTHGEGGGDGAFPRIAGFPAGYIGDQLRAFRDGARVTPLMSAMVTGLTDADIGALADYLARQQASFAAVSAGSPEKLARGQALVTLGAWERGIPACVSCHGPELEGVAPAIPRLAGQWPRYLGAQLTAYRLRQRPSDRLGLMSRIAGGMSTADIEDVSAYIGSLRLGDRPEPPRRATPEPYSPVPQSAEAFTPPPDAAIPAGPYGDMVRLGERLFQDTPGHADQYTGNALSCRNCHLDRGRAPQSSPMWAAYVHYPEYRKKDGLVNTLQMRIQGCFLYSQNGIAPPADSRELTALVTYFHWLATGLPVGITPKAAGYGRLPAPREAPSPERGAKVYASSCAVCHGEDGSGRTAGGRTIFPPLWGPQSFNWGAGMHQVDIAAAFIQRNMPYGAGGTLSDQEAWDVAAYVNSRPRPQDPRFTENVEKTRRLFHDGHFDYYGREVDGVLLGAPDVRR